MQTFLPYANYERSASALDDTRLNKQIMECRQIADAILGSTEAWLNHCITRMWEDAPKGCVLFGLACCNEWRRRGHQHHVHRGDLLGMLGQCERSGRTENYPVWFGRKYIHKAYRQHLAHKDKHYADMWEVEPKVGYYGKNKDGEIVLYPQTQTRAPQSRKPRTTARKPRKPRKTTK